MPRTAVTPATLDRNSGEAMSATTIDATLVTNGITVGTKMHGKCLVVVTNTAVAAKNVTVQQSDVAKYSDGGSGDLVVSVATNATVVLGPFDSGRFEADADALWVDFETGTTGSVYAVELP